MAATQSAPDNDDNDDFRLGAPRVTRPFASVSNPHTTCLIQPIWTRWSTAREARSVVNTPPPRICSSRRLEYIRGGHIFEAANIRPPRGWRALAGGRQPTRPTLRSPTMGDTNRLLPIVAYTHTLYGDQSLQSQDTSWQSIPNFVHQNVSRWLLMKERRISSQRF